ncbi:hypothetical protein HAX54_008468 [Datura stramonium]|uniref:Uncharacterized protein n=1 Tax=Datura stramonium TaxID=4076 RepID=A0ABS8TD88_DATST|nr:hypothetical protein [Datura stramonium]
MGKNCEVDCVLRRGSVGGRPAFAADFDLAKQQKLLDLPIWLPFLMTFTSHLGLQHLELGVWTLSPVGIRRNRVGSGLEEAQKNWVDMWAEDGARDEEENSQRPNHSSRLGLMVEKGRWT